MLQIVQMIGFALAGGFLSAFFTHLYARRVEREKIERRRVAVGTVIQAELATLYRELSDHEAKMEGYLKRVTNTVGATTKSDLPKMEIGERFFSIYQSTIPEIGLFDTETSYGVVYCYSNVWKFLLHQSNLIADLDSLMNSTMLGHRVRSLYDQEKALFQQIERIMPLLAQQSRAIPFTARPRREGGNQ